MDTNRTDHLFGDDAVGARLRALDPPAEWEPSPAIALARFHERVALDAPTSRRRWLWLAAAVPACLFILLLPPTRAVAQRMWDILWVSRAAFVTMDVNKLPASLTATRINVKLMAEQIGTQAEAAAFAQFAPRLPEPRTIADRPTFAVLGPMSFVATVKAADLQAALDREGITDRSIPPEWDGVKLAVHTSAIVTADYPDLQLVQCLPLALTPPAHFDFGAFVETVLRITGLSPSDARTFAAQLARTPVLIFPVTPDEAAQVRMRQVRLRTGLATLIHEDGDEGDAERITLIWSVPDRLYAISAAEAVGEDRVIAIANAIP